MGTVASNITQTVSFYNTTGVIEKGHNLYFCPNGEGNPLIYIQKLEENVLKNTNYANITISQWQPEDRVLTIKGRIEDFTKQKL